MDLMASLLELVGLPSHKNRPLDGISLIPVLNGTMLERPMEHGIGAVLSVCTMDSATNPSFLPFSHQGIGAVLSACTMDSATNPSFLPFSHQGIGAVLFVCTMGSATNPRLLPVWPHHASLSRVHVFTGCTCE
jgi:hypothetical protein